MSQGPEDIPQYGLVNTEGVLNYDLDTIVETALSQLK